MHHRREGLVRVANSPPVAPLTISLLPQLTFNVQILHDFISFGMYRHKIASIFLIETLLSIFNTNSPTLAPLSISPLVQLDFELKMERAEWYVGLATRLLFTNCYVIAAVKLSIRNTVSNKTNVVLFLYPFSIQTISTVICN